MWLKFCNSSVSKEEVIVPQFYKDLTRKTNIFEEYSWLKSNILGWLALGMALKLYTSVAKGLKLKIRMFWRLIPTFLKKHGKLNGRI